MATTGNVQIEKAISITQSLFTGIQTNNITTEEILSKNLYSYKNILFPIPYSESDLARITGAIDAGISATYRTLGNTTYTIQAGIKGK
jgi:hypothetical protein